MNNGLKILKFVLICLITYMCIFMLFKARYDYMSSYAKQHNCRWDYNDMCYTRAEKPWLFKD